jgi:hypothetical protein
LTYRHSRVGTCKAKEQAYTQRPDSCDSRGLLLSLRGPPCPADATPTASSFFLLLPFSLLLMLAPHLGINPSSVEQLLVCACLSDDSSTVQHEDGVSVSDGGETMSDDKDSAMTTKS